MEKWSRSAGEGIKISLNCRLIPPGDKEMNAQKQAFALAWTHAKAGKRVSLGKEQGVWVVKILKTKA